MDNLGPNLGNAMWHSGTLAAAKQGALLGIRSAALSTPTGGSEPDFDRLSPHVKQVLALLTSGQQPRLVNVNFPPDPHGLCWTRQANRHYDGHVVPGKDLMGRTHYWLTVRPIEAVEEGTDLWAVRRGLVSLTPLRLDLTDSGALSDAQGST